MRVAIDAAPLLDPQTGVGRYTRELAHHLETKGVDLRRFAVSWGGRAQEGVAGFRFPAKLARAVWRRFDAPAITRLTGPVDVVHGTNFVLPPTGDAAGVVTIHDLSFLHDYAFPGAERLRDLVPWSAVRADRIVVPTAAVRDEVVDYAKVEPETVVVTHEGVGEVFYGATRLSETALGRMGIPGPFILAVGTIEPRKNLGRLLEAWRAISSELPDWRLVLAGPEGWGPRLAETENVMLLGWLGDETLPGLLAAADIFCFPSLYEGFGLPPLEAMAAGTAVVAGTYSAAAEVLGDAALLVDPLDVDALAGALIGLASDPPARKRLAMAGRARAGSFGWAKTADATLEAYRQAAAARRERAST